VTDNALKVRERRVWNVDRAEWDAFAAHHEGSIRSSVAHLRAWAVKHALRSRVRLFEVYRGDPAAGQRVAQCAVAVTAGVHVFLDRMLIDEDGPQDWTATMAAVLEAADAGRCQYGWELSMEVPREGELASIPGVAVTAVRPLEVHAIDFRSWSDWDQYWQAISLNVRRNVKKAHAEQEGLRLDVRAGLSGLGHVPTIIRMRAAMYRRKGLPFRRTSAAMSAAGGILLCSEYALTAVAVSDSGPLAAFNGQAFAGNTYYAEGGSDVGIAGAAWFLMTEMVQRAYRENPAGYFIMGYLDPALHDEAVGGGLLRSRRSMRAAQYPTSVITFERTAGVG
jgi:hypothetical protein